MATFDWMTDPSFREEIEMVVKRVARENGMERYQNIIIEKLVGHLDNYQEVLLEQELKKSVFLQRSKQDAIRSIETLIKSASSIAKANNRTLLESSDFDSAYDAKFCMVWPFCGKK
ncbi:hypothetical protein DSLASN_22800 [Desulfoluna limicola]|uniref:Uncharacterized protein n=1 Tax=Desulfoluna limicola TaxID=2810562 RepID=A0ABM7PHI2_9BACT|nr:hypothetical protein [Desulfoluna limicola]BCS96648.1 hypothetical protein DSLASN_22800 [Desulfoluna limicola]